MYTAAGPVYPDLLSAVKKEQGNGKGKDTVIPAK